MMFIVGSMGVGKSSVARVLRNRGYRAIEYSQIATARFSEGDLLLNHDFILTHSIRRAFRVWPFETNVVWLTAPLWLCLLRVAVRDAPLSESRERLVRTTHEELETTRTYLSCPEDLVIRMDVTPVGEAARLITATYATQLAKPTALH